ncbi:hypothetical protein ACLD0W_15675 [Alloalcanivorax sp. C16-1]|uniref:hypothetical protein n=1 Tax=Alloalcanivorax sp. C16-1 TaxID=3390051 RepID=UPI003970AE88
MSEWLIVVGLSLLIMATAGLVRRAASQGHSTLLFLLPLAGWRQVQGHWDSYGLLALLRVLGLVCLLSGAGLFYLQRVVLAPAVAPGQVLRGAKETSASAFVQSPQASLLIARGEGRPLSGRLHGTALDPTARVTLINGVLSVQEGEGFLPERSLSVLLGWQGEDIDERRTLLVDPGQTDGPALHLSWTPEGRRYPETRIFHGGYRLELALAPLGEGRFSGTLQLLLPDARQSYLVGNFTAHADHLRYRDGAVDLFFDHPDTLAWVARQYLRTQYPDGAVERVVVENVNLRRADGHGQVQARVVLRGGTVERRRMTLEESPAGWAVTPGTLDRQVLDDQSGEAADSGGAGATSPDRSAPSTERRLARFDELSAHIGESVTVIEAGGQTHDGQLVRVAEDRLWLSRRIGAGQVELTLAAERVAAVRLGDGTRLVAPHDEPVGEGDPVSPDSDGADGPATLAGAEQWIGRRVTVTLTSGERRQGILRALDQRRLTLAVPMGAGSMEYFFPIEDIETLKETP